MFLFWILLARNRLAEENLKPISFHIHTTTGLLVIIDSLMVAFPIRFLHMIFSSAYAFVYIIFVLILHVTKVNSGVYSVLDFENNPLKAYLLACAAFTLFPFCFHSVIYLLYCLRFYIARRITQPTIKPLQEYSLATPVSSIQQYSNPQNEASSSDQYNTPSQTFSGLRLMSVGSLDES